MLLHCGTRSPLAQRAAFNPATNTGLVLLHACGPNGSTVGPDDNLLLGCTPQNNPSDTITLVINAKKPVGDEVLAVPRALWRFDRGVAGGCGVRLRGGQVNAGVGWALARLSTDDDGFLESWRGAQALPRSCRIERRRGRVVTSVRRA